MAVHATTLRRTDMPKFNPKKFPAEILVHCEDAGDGTQFLIADPSLRAHADMDDEVLVAVYTLHRVSKVRTKLVVT
jgi:hypothetical protein